MPGHAHDRAQVVLWVVAQMRVEGRCRTLALSSTYNAGYINSSRRGEKDCTWCLMRLNAHLL